MTRSQILSSLACPHLVNKDFIIWPALFVFFSSCCLHLRRPAYTELCNHLWHHCHHCFSSSKGFDFFKIFFIKFTSRDLLVLGIIIIIIIIIIILIIGLSGIQFGLLSYKWLIQSDDCEVGVGYINVNTKSCYQFIKTMTNLRKKLDVLVVHFHNKVCTWHMLSTHTGMMHQLFYYTVQTEAWHIQCPIYA